MGEVISIGKITQVIKKIDKQNKKIVLVGGCFDILHPGHVIFLEKAREAGDILVVLLESDKKVKILKGNGRPLHSQRMRAKVLSALCSVDYVVMLPYLASDTEYDELVERIRPDVIAAASKDVKISYHQRSAKKVGAKLKVVTKIIGDHSTSRILDNKSVE